MFHGGGDCLEWSTYQKSRFRWLVQIDRGLIHLEVIIAMKVWSSWKTHDVQNANISRLSIPAVAGYLCAWMFNLEQSKSEKLLMQWNVGSRLEQNISRLRRRQCNCGNKTCTSWVGMHQLLHFSYPLQGCRCRRLSRCLWKMLCSACPRGYYKRWSEKKEKC